MHHIYEQNIVAAPTTWVKTSGRPFRVHMSSCAPQGHGRMPRITVSNEEQYLSQLTHLRGRLSFRQFRDSGSPFCFPHRSVNAPCNHSFLPSIFLFIEDSTNVEIHLIRHGKRKGRAVCAVNKEAVVGLTRSCFSPQRPPSSVHC